MTTPTAIARLTSVIVRADTVMSLPASSSPLISYWVKTLW